MNPQKPEIPDPLKSNILKKQSLLKCGKTSSSQPDGQNDFPDDLPNDLPNDFPDDLPNDIPENTIETKVHLHCKLQW